MLGKLKLKYIYFIGLRDSISPLIRLVHGQENLMKLHTRIDSISVLKDIIKSMRVILRNDAFLNGI